MRNKYKYDIGDKVEHLSSNIHIFEYVSGYIADRMYTEISGHPVYQIMYEGYNNRVEWMDEEYLRPDLEYCRNKRIDQIIENEGR